MSNFGCHFGSSMPALIPLVRDLEGDEYVAIRNSKVFYKINALAEVFWYMNTQV